MYYVIVRLYDVRMPLGTTSGSWGFTHGVQRLRLETASSFMKILVSIHEYASDVSFSLMRVSLLCYGMGSSCYLKL